MHDVVGSHLAAWESFYIIVASSAGALTGLQFVVIALMAEVRPPSSRHAVSAFGTPNVVHFCAVLLIGAILSTPWDSLTSVALAAGIVGSAGVGYGLFVVRRALAQKDYKPDLGDWFWHTVLPFASYSSLVLAAFTLQRDPSSALFIVGAAALTLLFVGIHNAWDTVTYIAIGPPKAPTKHGKSEKA